MAQVDGTQKIDEKMQAVFMTLTVNGDECKFTHTAPLELSGPDLQKYIDAREDLYKLDILKDMYPGAIFKRREDETELQAMERWIAEGCKNPAKKEKDPETGKDIIMEPEKVVEKVPFEREHPPVVDYLKAQNLEEKLDIIAKAVFGG